MEHVYWDTRWLPEHSLDAGISWDVRVMYDWRSDLASLVRKVCPPGMGDYLDLDRRAAAYLTAAQEGQVHGDISTRELIPDDVYQRMQRAREQVVAELFHLKHNVLEERERYERVWPLLRNVRKIEKTGIHVDVDFVRSCLKRQDLAVHERAFMKGTLDTVKEGDLVYSKVTPNGTRTGRMSVESGFPSMTIPHGVCRQVVTSRFPGGKIVTLDFNAIDYRCLVSSLGDDGLKEFYRDQRDFHSKTASYVHAQRDITKKVTYTHLYGGSRKTLQKQTLLQEAEIDRMLSLLDGLFRSISGARTIMAEEARQVGYVTTPSGNRVEVQKDDHDGKIVGLYAQTFSSEVFAKALDIALRGLDVRGESMRSTAAAKIIFTVHDEIVFDVPGNELILVDLIAENIEKNTGFVVKVKKGENYAEATE